MPNTNEIWLTFHILHTTMKQQQTKQKNKVTSSTSFSCEILQLNQMSPLTKKWMQKWMHTWDFWRKYYGHCSKERGIASDRRQQLEPILPPWQWQWGLALLIQETRIRLILAKCGLKTFQRYPSVQEPVPFLYSGGIDIIKTYFHLHCW